MDAAVRRFFSSPHFAVAGASNDTHKFGYKSENPTTHQLRKTTQDYTRLTSYSPRLVSPALTARDTAQSPSSADLTPLACLRYGPLTDQIVLA